MKYKIQLGYLANHTADVEVEADSHQEAIEEALRVAPQARFTCEDEGGRTEVQDIEEVPA